MGLATSQVRLLALTSRKADVELQIQLNSKRKTLLARESTQLSKLYYAKLQQSKVKYTTTNGYKDITYSYLMGNSGFDYMWQIAIGKKQGQSPTNDVDYNIKSLDNMILTDSYGKVILDDEYTKIVVDTLNVDYQSQQNGNQPASVETLTYLAVVAALAKHKETDSDSPMAEAYSAMEDIVGTKGVDNTTVYVRYKGGQNEDGTYNEKSMKGSEFIKSLISGEWSSYDRMSRNSNFKGKVHLSTTIGYLANLLNYYGNIFSAAFNGSGPNGAKYNGATEIEFKDGKYQIVENTNTLYKNTQNSEKFQEGLKSGLYQIVSVESPLNGVLEKNRNMDYFKTLGLVVEQTDNSVRESITAWFNAERANLEEKESYWDTEITALSTELSTITTEIESVKKLREDAISTTFKWGGA